MITAFQTIVSVLTIAMPSLTEWIIILIVVLLLFGGKKIPELMRGLGQGVRSFKQGMHEIENEIQRPVDAEQHTANQPDKADDNNNPSPDRQA